MDGKTFNSPISMMALSLVSGMAVAFFVAHWWPELVDIGPWWWLVVAILALAKPMLRIFGMKQP